MGEGAIVRSYYERAQNSANVYEATHITKHIKHAIQRLLVINRRLRQIEIKVDKIYALLHFLRFNLQKLVLSDLCKQIKSVNIGLYMVQLYLNVLGLSVVQVVFGCFHKFKRLIIPVKIYNLLHKIQTE